MQNWLKETSRDLIALASLPFYLIAIVRVAIAEHKIYSYQLIIALIIIYAVYFIFKKSINLYASMAIPLLTFTNLYYSDTKYLIFSSILGIFLIISLFYLNSKKKHITLGLGAGVISAFLAYLIAPLI